MDWGTPWFGVCMLVGFIGIPSSGKTTAAAQTFVELKKMGVSAEFVVEIARQHIAKKRQKTGVEQVVLDDKDQVEIMHEQLNAERLMNSPKTIVVSDSSPLNSLMYMGEYVKGGKFVKGYAQMALESYDLLVLCPEQRYAVDGDVNRLHGESDRARLTAARDELMLMVTKLRPDLAIFTMYDQGDGPLTLAYSLVDLFYEKNK